MPGWYKNTGENLGRDIVIIVYVYCSIYSGDIYLLIEDIAGQEDGEGDADDKEDIAPSLLRSRAHELVIIDTEEEADREYGEEAAIEHLGHQDDQNTVN